MFTAAKRFVLNLLTRESQNLPGTDGRSSQDQCDQCSLSIRHPIPSHYGHLSVSPQTVTENLPRGADCLHLQQSLLILIHLHLLKRLLKSSLGVNHDEPRNPLLTLQHELPTFIIDIGYVSNRFYDSAMLAVKMFLETNSFHVVSIDLPQFYSLAGLFEAEVQSVFLQVGGIFQASEFLSCSHIVSGLMMRLDYHNDCEFLNMSSPLLFPFLRELHLLFSSFPPENLFDLLKINDTLTVLNLMRNFMGDEAVKALAGALKVNSKLTSINLCLNAIGPEGAATLAESLKVNTTVKVLYLCVNSVGDEGAAAFAETLKVNTTLTTIGLKSNLIGDNGVKALVEALQINTTVTTVDLCDNSCIGEAGRALVKTSKANETATRFCLDNHSVLS
ncbi:hypothetical protein GEMRC1_006872 [Eukaryota sp. GEM-RC1]